MKSLVLIAVVASILLLRELEPLLVPLTIALILSLVLAPAVDALQRRHLPRGLAAVLVTFGLSAVVLAIVSLGWLWGVGGMFIAVPALVICKIVLSQLDQPGPRIARVLGR